MAWFDQQTFPRRFKDRKNSIFIGPKRREVLKCRQVLLGISCPHLPRCTSKGTLRSRTHSFRLEINFQLVGYASICLCQGAALLAARSLMGALCMLWGDRQMLRSLLISWLSPSIFFLRGLKALPCIITCIGWHLVMINCIVSGESTLYKSQWSHFCKCFILVQIYF